MVAFPTTRRCEQQLLFSSSSIILLLLMVSSVHPFAPSCPQHHHPVPTHLHVSSLPLSPPTTAFLWRNDTTSSTGGLTTGKFVDHLSPTFAQRQRRKSQTTTARRKYRVFCDLDGVLVDFGHGIAQAFPEESSMQLQSSSQNIDAIPRHQLWERVQSVDAFFEHLPWCHGGQALWNALRPLRPDILTGVPSYCHRAPREEKFNWCVRELATVTTTAAEETTTTTTPVQFQHTDKAGRWRQHVPVKNAVVRVPQQQQQQRQPAATTPVDDEDAWTCRVITCWSEQKHHESGPDAVLIDDRIDLKGPWEAKGGIFIHHITGNTEWTLQQLRQHGILPPACSEQQEADDALAP